MLYGSFFALHIIGACVTALIGAYAIAMLWRREERKYSISASVLGAVAGFEVITGILLSVLSLKITALSLCGNIALYLSIVLLLEAMLFVRMKKGAAVFPTTTTFAPIAASLLSFATAAAYGF